MKDLKLADEKLVELMFFGLDYGLENIENDSLFTLIPIVFTENEGERELHRFVAEQIVENIEKGEEYIKSDRKNRYAVIVYDGFLTVEGNKKDAVFVKGFDRKDEVGYVICQRYRFESGSSEILLVGNAAFLGNSEQFLE